MARFRDAAVPDLACCLGDDTHTPRCAEILKSDAPESGPPASKILDSRRGWRRVRPTLWRDLETQLVNLVRASVAGKSPRCSAILRCSCPKLKVVFLWRASLPGAVIALRAKESPCLSCAQREKALGSVVPWARDLFCNVSVGFL